MALGVVFLLGNFDIIDYDRIFDFWPVIIIVIGLKMIVDYLRQEKQIKGRTTWPTNVKAILCSGASS